jgi:hypothetical protein
MNTSRNTSTLHASSLIAAVVNVVVVVLVVVTRPVAPAWRF